VISHASWDDGPQVPGRLQGRVFWLLGRAARNAQQVTQASLFAAGLRRGFYGVLATLDEFGPGSQAEIGRRLGFDPSDMVDIINDLERQGYVARQPDPDDRRRNKVTLTGAGEKALGRFDAAITEAEDALLAGIPRTERERLARALALLAGGTSA
jgi:MarR family transcriptional regulator, lower aerobic nicotinate degradation pathway regulator